LTVRRIAVLTTGSLASVPIDNSIRCTKDIPSLSTKDIPFLSTKDIPFPSTRLCTLVSLYQIFWSFFFVSKPPTSETCIFVFIIDWLKFINSTFDWIIGGFGIGSLFAFRATLWRTVSVTSQLDATLMQR